MAVEKDKIVTVYATKTKAELEALTEANVLGFPTDSSVITFGDREYGVGKEYHLPARVIDGNSLSLSNLDQSGKKVLSYSGMNPETGATEGMSMAMPDATTTDSGLMSAGDKTKLNGIPASVYSKSEVDKNLAIKANKADVYTKEQTDAAINNKVSVVYKPKGSKSQFSDLTTADQVIGDVWNILTPFTLDGDSYPAGTNVVWIGEDALRPAHWDALSGAVDLTPYAKVANLPSKIIEAETVRFDGDAEFVVLVFNKKPVAGGAVEEGWFINLPDASTTEAGTMSAADKTKLNGIQAGAQVNAVTSVAGRTGAVTLTKNDVGLGNVTNESKATMFTNAALTGTPTAPTAAKNTNNTQIANTAFVRVLYNDLATAIAAFENSLADLTNRLSILENALKVK